MDIRKLREKLFGGLVIPAHPLALTNERKLDERHQRALTRYYCAAGAGGLAVAVHTTQFAIRQPTIGLFRPVLEMARETAHDNSDPPLLISGICGSTPQALSEAETALRLGYDAGLVSLAGMSEATDREMVLHCKQIADVLPIIGFYLQPAVGGRALGYSFWRQFCAISNAVAIKIAPFNRYQTLDVIRAVAESGRAGEIALYTGNDDSILVDLLSTYRFGGESIVFAGGLLGQWAVGTRAAVGLLKEARRARSHDNISQELISRAHSLTDTNAALFDASNGFRGCIAGIHEVLRRQGLLAGRWCLDPDEELSPGQMEEIDRVLAAYPELHDDEFIRRHRDEWLR